jgi:hypothetical protein
MISAVPSFSSRKPSRDLGPRGRLSLPIPSRCIVHFEAHSHVFSPNSKPDDHKEMLLRGKVSRSLSYCIRVPRDILTILPLSARVIPSSMHFQCPQTFSHSFDLAFQFQPSRVSPLSACICGQGDILQLPAAAQPNCAGWTIPNGLLAFWCLPTNAPAHPIPLCLSYCASLHGI